MLRSWDKHVSKKYTSRIAESSATDDGICIARDCWGVLLNMLSIILLGSPGSGRSTLGRILSRRWDIPLICTGDLLRSAAEKIGPVAKAIRHTINGGNLVSDEIVNHLLASELGSPDCADGFVLDGFPRTAAQAQFLSDVLPRIGASDPMVLQLNVSPEIAMEWIQSRVQCVGCGRAYNSKLWPSGHPGYCDDDGMPLVKRTDDVERSIATSLRRYAETAASVIAHYRNANYHVLDAGSAPGTLLETVEGVVAQQQAFRFALA